MVAVNMMYTGSNNVIQSQQPPPPQSCVKSPVRKGGGKGRVSVSFGSNTINNNININICDDDDDDSDIIINSDSIDSNCETSTKTKSSKNSHRKKDKKSSSSSSSSSSNTKKKNKKTKKKKDDDNDNDNNKMNHGVKFADEYERVYKVVPRLSMYSPEELSMIWFEGEDFEDFVDDALKTVEKIEQGKTLRDKKYTATGLENFTEEGRALKDAFREEAYDAVMYEQDYQHKQGRRDSATLAALYAQVSRQASKRAVQMAMELHKDVISFLTNDDIGVTKKSKTKNNNIKRRAQKRRSSF